MRTKGFPARCSWNWRLIYRVPVKPPADPQAPQAPLGQRSVKVPPPSRAVTAPAAVDHASNLRKAKAAEMKANYQRKKLNPTASTGTSVQTPQTTGHTVSILSIRCLCNVCLRLM